MLDALRRREASDEEHRGHSVLGARVSGTLYWHGNRPNGSAPPEGSQIVRGGGRDGDRGSSAVEAVEEPFSDDAERRDDSRRLVPPDVARQLRDQRDGSRAFVQWREERHSVDVIHEQVVSLAGP